MPRGTQKSRNDTHRDTGGDPDISDPPEWLDETAAAEYRRIIEAVESDGITAPLDAATLASYADAYGAMVKTARALREEGEVITGPRGGLTVNPTFYAHDKAFRRLLACARELGFTPTSRKRLGKAKGSTPDPLAEMMGES